MQTLGKYTLFESLGRGGFGAVYRAQEEVLKVIRAVKVLHPALVADSQFIDRFRNEAQTAAQLEHPNIVPVYELGEDNGRFYLAMKYMPGGSLKEYLEKTGRLGFARALEITRQVASGLEFAHSQGMVHRDVKPGNILFEQNGVARLSDFGFSRALQGVSSASLSASGGMVGTPQYMAPEIWRGKGAAPATDVYSLACVFVEMITGNVLFQGDSPPEIMTRHILDGPQLPQTWPQDVPEMIGQVLSKALAREPGERYSSPLAFVADLEKMVGVKGPQTEEQSPPVIEENPVIVTPPGYRTPTWVWLMVIASGTLIITCILFALLETKGGLFTNLISFSFAPKETNSAAVHPLDEQINTGETGEQAGVTPRPLLTPSPSFTPKPSLTPSPEPLVLEKLMDWGLGSVHHILLPLDDSLLVVSTNLGVYFYDRLTFERRNFIETPSEMSQLSADQTTLFTVWMGTVQVWELNTGTLVTTFAATQSEADTIVLDPTGKYLAVGAIDDLALVDTTNFQVVARLDRPEQNWDADMAFSPDGSRLAIGWGNNVVLLALPDLSQVAEVGELIPSDGTPVDSTERIRTLSFSPDGQVIAFQSSNSVSAIWDIQRNQKISELELNHWVDHLQFTPDGTRVMVLGADEMILWDWQRNQQIYTLNSTWPEWGFFTSDGSRFYSGGYLDRIIEWDAQSGNSLRILPLHEGQIDALSFSPTGDQVALGSGGNALIVNIHDGTLERVLSGRYDPIQDLAYSPDGTGLVVGHNENTDYYSLTYYTVQKTLEGLDTLDFSADGRRLVIGDWDNLYVWEIPLPATQPWVKIFGREEYGWQKVSISPDGSWLASGNQGGSIKFFDIGTTQEIHQFSQPEQWFTSTDISARGDLVASSIDTGEVKIWDARQWNEVCSPQLDGWHASDLEFSPDGQILAVGDWGGVVHLYNAVDCRRLASTTHTQSYNRMSVSWSPDGKLLAVGSTSGILTLYAVTP